MNREPVTINGKTWIYDPKTKTHRPADRVADGGSAVPAANVEPSPRNAPAAEKQALPFDSPVCIEILSYRCRLCDTDNVSGKAAIDGTVNCGILRDDSTKEVSEVRYRQEKVQSIGQEETYLIFTRTE